MSGDRTLIIGLGATGYSCLKHLHGSVPVAVCDTRQDPPYGAAARTGFADVEVLDPPAVEFSDFDRAVISPGMGLDHCLARAAREAGLEILGDIDLFLERAGAPVIAITGTNGKSTVASMVGQLLDRPPNEVRVGGNLGVPALDLLDSTADWYVLELSSFQLERMGSGTFDIGAVLNVSADHLDRHRSFEDYRQAKRRVYCGCRAAVYNGQDINTRPPTDVPAIALNENPDWRVAGDEMIIDGTSFPLSSFQLRGRHNAFNVVAACAIASLTGREVLAERLFDFRGLPHRSAFVGTVGSVRCVDDSKATNVGACSAALAGFGEDGDVVLIAGGDGKNASFEPLKSPVARYAKHVVLIGRDAPRIEAALGGVVPVSQASDMDRAVAKALAAARGRGIVLLSPACASFDMFDDFEARGDAFAAAVQRAASSHG